MFNKLDEKAIIPQYQTAGSVGLDLHSIEDTYLLPGQTKVVHTGLTIDLPPNIEGQVRPRSGLAAKHGITVLNSPGTIDTDYKGEIMVILHNTSDEMFAINEEDRIAQLVLCPVFIAEEYMSDRVRGTGGFGSTGS